MHGWLVICLRGVESLEDGGQKGAISIHGFVPTYAYGAYAETLLRIEGTLTP